MPMINVQLLEGRTPDQKSELIERLATVTRETLCVPDEAIRIILTEVAPEHWGVGSRSMAVLRPALQADGADR